MTEDVDIQIKTDLPLSVGLQVLANQLLRMTRVHGGVSVLHNDAYS